MNPSLNLIKTDDVAPIQWFRRIMVVVGCVLVLSIIGRSQSVPLNKVWDRTYGGGSADLLYSMVATIDGGYLLGGRSLSGVGGDKTEGTVGNGDYWVVKIDKDGQKLWDKTFGRSDLDVLQSLVTTTDGGYLLGGYSGSLGGGPGDDRDYWVVKIDREGNKQWDRSYGGNAFDQLYSVVNTVDGGYLLGGYSSSGIGRDKSDPSSSADYWIIKIDENGQKQWDKTYGGVGGDLLSSIVPNKEGGYCLGGTSNSGIGGDKSETVMGRADYWVINIDEDGKKLWDKTYGTDEGTQIYGDNFSSMITTSDGGYLLGGFVFAGIGGDKTEGNRGFFDYWIVKLDIEGRKEWDKTFGGRGADYLYSMAETGDGGYLLSGYSQSGIEGDKTELNNGGDYWIVKVDTNGKKLWDKTFGGISSDFLTSLTSTPDGGYLLGGSSGSGVGGDKSEPNRGSDDFWVIKVKPVAANDEKRIQTIMFDSIPSYTFGDPPFKLLAQASSGLPVSFSVLSGPGALSGDSITLIGAGVVIIEATQSGNDLYNAAPAVLRTFRIEKANPQITWTPDPITDGAPLEDGHLNASATFKSTAVAGAFMYDPPLGTRVSVGTQTLTADFTPLDTSIYNSIIGITRAITVSPRPSSIGIRSFSPSSGPAGTLVIIRGSNLSKAATVSFNGVNSKYINFSDNLLITTVPLGATTGLISVGSNDGTTSYSATVFRVTYPKPSILFFTPGSGHVGTMVTIVGANLGGTKEVRFNGTSTSYFTVVSPYVIQAKVPYGATTGRIRVETPGGGGTSSYNFILEKDEAVTKQQASKAQEVKQAGAPVVYPNPFRYAFTIKFHSHEKENKKVPITVYALTGEVVLRRQNVVSGQQIKAGRELSPGMYILQVGQGKDSKHYTIVKID